MTTNPQKIEGGWDRFFNQFSSASDSDKIEFLWGKCADMGSSDGMLMSVKRVSMFIEGILYWHNKEIEKAKASERQRCVDSLPKKREKSLGTCFSDIWNEAIDQVKHNLEQLK